MVRTGRSALNAVFSYAMATALRKSQWLWLFGYILENSNIYYFRAVSPPLGGVGAFTALTGNDNPHKAEHTGSIDGTNLYVCIFFYQGF